MADRQDERTTTQETEQSQNETGAEPGRSTQGANQANAQAAGHFLKRQASRPNGSSSGPLADVVRALKQEGSDDVVRFQIKELKTALRHQGIGDTSWADNFVWNCQKALLGDPHGRDWLVLSLDQALHAGAIDRGRIPALLDLLIADGALTEKQRQAALRDAAKEPAKDDASVALEAASRVLAMDLTRSPPVAQRYQAAIDALVAAKSGSGSGKERMAELQKARSLLRPALLHYEAGGAQQKQWAQENVVHKLDELESGLNASVAQQRVKESRVDEEGNVKEGGGESAAKEREEAHELHDKIKKVHGVLAQLAEQGLRLNEEAIEHALKHMGPRLSSMWKDKGSIAELSGILALVDGMLVLSDDEFQKEMKEIGKHGAFQGIATFTEFLKATVEITAGCVVAGAAFAEFVAKAAGQADMAIEAAQLSRGVAMKLSTVVSALEVTHGLLVMCNKHATPAQKGKAGEEIVNGGMGLGLTLGGAAAAPALPFAIGVFVAIQELKLTAKLWVDAQRGITGLWAEALFQRMRDDGDRICGAAGDLMRAAELAHGEKDAGQKAALENEARRNCEILDGDLHEFLRDCKGPIAFEGSAYKPAAYPQVRKRFEPALASAQTGGDPVKVAKLSNLVLGEIKWCLANQDGLKKQIAGV